MHTIYEEDGESGSYYSRQRLITSNDKDKMNSANSYSLNSQDDRNSNHLQSFLRKSSIHDHQVRQSFQDENNTFKLSNESNQEVKKRSETLNDDRKKMKRL